MFEIVRVQISNLKLSLEYVMRTAYVKNIVVIIILVLIVSSRDCMAIFLLWTEWLLRQNGSCQDNDIEKGRKSVINNWDVLYSAYIGFPEKKTREYVRKLG